MPARARPLSPHLTIYRWEIGMSLSILHRITGGFLALGLLVLAYWWSALAAGPEAYAVARRVLTGPLGLLVLAGLSFAFCFHLINGVRHLIWDAGHGFEKGGRRGGGLASIASAIVLTLVIWLVVWRHLS